MLSLSTIFLPVSSKAWTGVYLERVTKGDYVGMQDCSQDLAFSSDIISMLLLQDFLFPHHLHGIYLPCVLLSDLKYLQQPLCLQIMRESHHFLETKIVALHYDSTRKCLQTISSANGEAECNAMQYVQASVTHLQSLMHKS